MTADIKVGLCGLVLFLSFYKHCSKQILSAFLLFLVGAVTFLSSAYNTQSLQKNSVFPDLQSDETDMLYSAYGDDTGVQCALRYHSDYSKKKM